MIFALFSTRRACYIGLSVGISHINVGYTFAVERLRLIRCYNALESKACLIMV